MSRNGYLEIDCYTYIQRVLLAFGRKIDIFKLIYRYLLAFEEKKKKQYDKIKEKTNMTK